MRTISCTSKPADETKPAKEDKKEPEIEKKDEDEAEEKPDDEADDEEEDKPDKKKRGKPARKGVAKKSSKADRKRGPARPYRKLPQDTLDTRIKKLEKRIERTSAQAEEGKNFLVKYTREQAFRDAEALPAAG